LAQGRLNPKALAAKHNQKMIQRNQAGHQKNNQIADVCLLHPTAHAGGGDVVKLHHVKARLALKKSSDFIYTENFCSWWYIGYVPEASCTLTTVQIKSVKINGPISEQRI
jgi:hypothetical protein